MGGCFWGPGEVSEVALSWRDSSGRWIRVAFVRDILSRPLENCTSGSPIEITPLPHEDVKRTALSLSLIGISNVREGAPRLIQNAGRILLGFPAQLIVKSPNCFFFFFFNWSMAGLIHFYYMLRRPQFRHLHIFEALFALWDLRTFSSHINFYYFCFY